MAERTCTADGCERTRNARGLCPTHYSQWRRATLADSVAAEAWQREQQVRVDARMERQRAADKVCTKCGAVKPKSEFSPAPTRPDGRHVWCKGCLRELAKANYDPARAKAKHDRAKSDPAYRAGRKATYDRWRSEHPDRMAAATRSWRERRREHVRAVTRAWVEANRDVMRIKRRGYGAARRRRMSGAGVDYMAILTEHGMTCHICRDVIADLTDLHFDHVIPLARGGHHSAENIRPSHALCNMRKGARIIA